MVFFDDLFHELFDGGVIIVWHFTFFIIEFHIVFVDTDADFVGSVYLALGNSDVIKDRIPKQLGSCRSKIGVILEHLAQDSEQTGI